MDILELDNNESWTIIVQPADSSFIDQDSTLNIIVEPVIPLQNLASVEILLDENSIVQFSYPPFQTEISLHNLDTGIHILKVITTNIYDKITTNEITFNIRDYREKYYGDYNYLIYKTVWNISLPPQYDTFPSSGLVRAWTQDDKINQLFFPEPPDTDELIYIKFGSYGFTTLVDHEGNFKSGWVHEHQSGTFISSDSVKISVNTGGLGDGVSYLLYGKKVGE